MRYSLPLAIACFSILSGCNTALENVSSKNPNFPGNTEEPTTEPAPTFTLSGSVTGYTSDMSLKLVVNGTEEETASLAYTNSYPTVEFVTALLEGDTLALTVDAQPQNEFCEVTSLTETVGTSAPVFEVSCQNACDDNSLCNTWLDNHNTSRDALTAGTVTDVNNMPYPQPASPIQPLRWNPDLAQLAQTHADSCDLLGNSDRQSEYFEATGLDIRIGENLASIGAPISSTATDAQFADYLVGLWWKQSAKWSYQQYQSASTASSFTQMAWANTAELGCGIATCPNADSTKKTVIAVCNYAIGGNVVGEYPYLSATN